MFSPKANPHSSIYTPPPPPFSRISLNCTQPAGEMDVCLSSASASLSGLLMHRVSLRSLFPVWLENEVTRTRADQAHGGTATDMLLHGDGIVLVGWAGWMPWWGDTKMVLCHSVTGGTGREVTLGINISMVDGISDVLCRLSYMPFQAQGNAQYGAVMYCAG